MPKVFSLRAALLALLCLCLLPAASAWAQTPTSRVTGTVKDATGAVVPGALVTLTNEATNVSFSTRTTQVGTYVFESVQISVYTVKVEAQGFKTFISRGNQLNIAQPMTVNATLEVGAVAETVEVESSYERVQTSSSGNYGNLVDQTQLQSLPIILSRGRTPLELVNYQPGVNSGANTGGGTHVNGARDRSWNYTLDGIDVNESTAGGAETTPFRLNPDMLAEFRVVTGGQTAEFGRNSGGQVTMITKSGTNDFHADLFYLYRTAGLDANIWENNRLGQSKDKFIQHIYGVSGGGPIIRNKTFFFANFQGLRAPRTRPFTAIVYTADARAGRFRYVTAASAPCPGQTAPRNSTDCVDPSTGNLVSGITVDTYDVAANDPLSRGLDPEIQAFVDLTPLPNNFTAGDGLNTAGFSWQPPGGEEQELYTVKLDHVLSPENTFFGRVSWGTDDTPGDVVNGGNSRFPGLPRVVDTTRDPLNLATGWRGSRGSSFTNELVFGLNFFTFDFGNPDPNFASNPPFDLGNATEPLFNFVGNLREAQTYQLADNMTYAYGAHTLKAGYNFRFQEERDQRASIGGANASLSVNFSPSINTVDATAFNLPGDINANDISTLRQTINELLGRVGTMSQGFVSNSEGTAYAPAGTKLEFLSRYDELDFYFQDSWKVLPNFLLELGLRWEVKKSPVSTNRQILVPNQPVFAGAPSTDTLRWVPGNLFDTDSDNVAPIVGFAWDPRGDGRLSVRGTYRMAYDRINPFVISSRIYQSLPGQALGVFNTSFGSNGGRVSDGLPSLQPTARPSDGVQPDPFSTSGNVVFDPNWEVPETHMWGLSFQYDIGNEMVVDVTYNGRYGNNLIGAYDVNQVDIFASGVPGAPGCTENFLQAFLAVQGGGVSCLIDALLSSERANGSDWVRSNFPTTLARNSVGSLASTLSNRVSGGTQVIAASGFPSNFFKSFPQYSGFLWVIDSGDYSHYHGVTFQLTRRLKNGFSFNVNYTLSRSKDTRSFDPTFTVVSTGSSQSSSSSPFDIFDRRLNYARSDFDRKHSLKGYFTYELPFGRGKYLGSDVNDAVQKIIGGWEFNGLLRWLSGRPFTVYSEGFPQTQVVRTPADCVSSNCSNVVTTVHSDPSNGQVYYFDRGTGLANFSTPAPGQASTLGRNAFTTDDFYRLDVALGKRVSFAERHSVEFFIQVTNLTNTPQWDFPPVDEINSSLFGRLLDPRDDPRRFQWVLKYHF